MHTIDCSGTGPRMDARSIDSQTYCCAVLDSSQRWAYGTGNQRGSVLHSNKSNEVLVPVFKQEIEFVVCCLLFAFFLFFLVRLSKSGCGLYISAAYTPENTVFKVIY